MAIMREKAADYGRVRFGDKTPGQVTGNNIGGAWHVIKIKA